ncbi:porin family protein [Prevotella sp.]|uniref:porin family protein n=1 Tax=Prevotella sp. TaxID=59823 RepID=UPI002F950FC4
MKKLFLAIVAMIMAAPSFAQYSSGGFTFNEESVYYGARIGLTVAGIGGDRDLGSKAGMTLGGVVGVRCSNSVPVFVESGLYYTERGGKKGSVKTSLNYLEIPVLIKYGFKATEGIAILPFIGPYFSYAIGGKTTIEADGVKQKISSFRDGQYKHADMGFKLGCGAEYNNLYLELGYQFGVTNISKNDQLDARGHAFVANFGVNF